MKNTSIKVNYLYNLSYQILSIIAPIITTPYVARVLGAGNVGTYSFVVANVEYFLLFGLFGNSTFSQFEVAKKRDSFTDLQDFCTNSFFTRTITLFSSLLIYFVLCVSCGKENKIFYMVMVMNFLSAWIDFSWLCYGLEDFKQITIKNSLVKLVGIIAIFLFVNDATDLFVYFCINSIIVLLGNISILPYAKKYISISKINVKYVGGNIKGALLYFLPSMASTIIYSSDKIMIGLFSNNSIQNGYYEQAVRIETMIFLLFASLYVTLRPRMAYLYKVNNRDAINCYIGKCLSFVFYLAIPASVGLFCISDILVPWFLGDGYGEVARLLKIMSGWIFVKSISNCLLETGIIAKGEMIRASKIIWCGAIVNVVLNFVLVPRFLSIGAAFASLITEIFILVLIVQYVRENSSIVILWSDILKEICSVFLMMTVVCFVKTKFSGGLIPILLTTIIGTITYLLGTAVLKNKESFYLIQVIINKLKSTGKEKKCD